MNAGQDVNGRYPEIIRVLGVDGALYLCRKNKLFTAFFPQHLNALAE